MLSKKTLCGPSEACSPNIISFSMLGRPISETKCSHITESHIIVAVLFEGDFIRYAQCFINIIIYSHVSMKVFR